MKVSGDGIMLMHYFESCKLKAYPDPGSADGRPWTIGWGHTGPEVKPGLVWTQEQADAAFAKDLESTERAVSRMVPNATQGEFDALVSFAYNLGAAALESSTLLRKYRAGDKQGAAEEFKRWNKNGKPLKPMLGLARRREAERARFTGIPGALSIAMGASVNQAIA